MTTTQETKNSYKATFILDSRGVQDSVEALIEKLKQALERVEASVKEAKNLGYKAFTRITDKKHPGDYYVEMTFSAPASAPLALQQNLRLDKTVKRIFIVNE